MLSKVVLAFSLSNSAVGAPLAGELDWSQYTYSQYLKEFGAKHSKSYSDERKANFEKNLKEINEHNARDDKTWFATVNKFTDMSKEEFKAFVKGKYSPPSENAPRSSRLEKLSLSDLPTSMDWRDQKVVTDVNDQGQCGSCWAWSSAQTFESHLALATGEPVQKLSAQQIISCSPNPQQCGGTGGCDGSTQPLAYNYTSAVGLTREVNYPYSSDDTGDTGACKKSKIVPVGINSGYEELPRNDYTALMTAVGTKGPIAISVAASGKCWQHFGGGIASKCNDYDMDHAVQLVGYGSEKQLFGSIDYWLVRNSWGEFWGQDGYIKLRRYGEGKEPCGTDSTPGDGDACKGDTAPRKYCGETAILSSSSYPTGLKSVPAPPAPTPAPKGKGQCKKSSPVNQCGHCQYELDCMSTYAPGETLCLQNGDPDCGSEVELV